MVIFALAYRSGSFNTTAGCLICCSPRRGYLKAENIRKKAVGVRQTREQGWVSALAAQLDQASAAIGTRNLAIQALHAQLQQARALNHDLAAAAAAAVSAGEPAPAAAQGRAVEAVLGGSPANGGPAGEARTLRLVLGQRNAALAERAAQVATPCSWLGSVVGP